MVKEFEHEIDLWLRQISIDIKRSSAHQPSNLDATIQPEDSVSNVGSEASYRTCLSCNSYPRSTTSESYTKKPSQPAKQSVYEKIESGELVQLRPPTSIAHSGQSRNPTKKPESEARHQTNNWQSQDESIRRIVEMQGQQSTALSLLIQQQQQGVMALYRSQACASLQWRPR